jgi:hypothetical protein
MSARVERPRLTAFEAAFGPGYTVRVYTSQRNDVANRLAAGELHVQPWLRTAAYDLSSRGSRVAHKRGYLWMAREYERRMGRPLRAAPVWVSFDVDTMLRMRGPEWYPQRKATERFLRYEWPPHRGQLKSGPGPGSTKLNMQRPEVLVTSYALTVLRNPELVCTTSKASACERTRALGLDGACPMHPQGRASTISVPLGATGIKAPSETTPTAPSARRMCASVKTVRLSGPKEF